MAARVLDEFEDFLLINKQVDNLLARLSPREAEILRHIAGGSSSQQLAQTLHINEETIRHQLRLILSKLVSNDHNREVIEAAQSGLPSTFPRAGKLAPEYITKDEFVTFKQTITERLKSFIGELS